MTFSHIHRVIVVILRPFLYIPEQLCWKEELLSVSETGQVVCQRVSKGVDDVLVHGFNQGSNDNSIVHAMKAIGEAEIEEWVEKLSLPCFECPLSLSISSLLGSLSLSSSYSSEAIHALKWGM